MVRRSGWNAWIMSINLISDTVTRPTAGMLKAMMGAEVGDDVFKQDPTVNALEEKMASMFGMDAALFFPSGTMANQTAIKLHTDPGDQVICESMAHVFNYEGGGASFNSGVSCKLVQGHRGMMTAEQVESVINPPDFYHSPRTRLVCVENTTNKGGGACWDISELERIRAVCRKHGLFYHLDGARIFNALVARGEEPATYGSLFNTICVSLSKGLGCPVGSVLIGSKENMERALRIRKILGGGMRQSGYLAAAGLYALENHVERLAVDHKKAREIGELLGGVAGVKEVAPVETNIVIFELDPGYMSAGDFVKTMNEKGVAIIEMGGGKLRMVTHLDYTDAMHKEVTRLLRSL